MTIVATVFAIFSLGWVIYLHLCNVTAACKVSVGWACAVIWAIVPIFWFREESLQLIQYKKYGITKLKLEHIKVNHESAKSFWFWIGALILTFLTSR